MFKTIKKNIIHENKWTKFFEDEIEFENGEQGLYGYIERQDGVVVIILNQNKEILLINQYRYPIQKYEWNLPGGGIDGDETAEQAAIREVGEETGIEIKDVEKIGAFYPLSSASTELVTIFLAHVRQNVDVRELTNNQIDESVSERRWVSIEKCLEMIDKGEITDGMTCNAVQLVVRKIKNH
jgi:ADP-ribose pyrophosphatase